MHWGELIEEIWVESILFDPAAHCLLRSDLSLSFSLSACGDQIRDQIVYLPQFLWRSKTWSTRFVNSSWLNYIPIIQLCELADDSSWVTTLCLLVSVCPSLYSQVSLPYYPSSFRQVLQTNERANERNVRCMLSITMTRECQLTSTSLIRKWLFWSSQTN